jgi:hypothetical protein
MISNRATRIANGEEPNPPSDPGNNLSNRLDLYKIYDRLDHVYEEIRVVESLLDRLGSQLESHAKVMHPHGNVEYEADVKILRIGEDENYFVEWRCPTCRFIHDKAALLNKELDQLHFDAGQQTPWPDHEVRQVNKTLNAVDEFPFPWPDFLNTSGTSKETSVDEDNSRDTTPRQEDSMVIS